MFQPRLHACVWGTLAALLLLGPALGAVAPNVDATGCLAPTRTGAASTCTHAGSLSVTLKNTCKFAIRVQLCLRGANHLWVACTDSQSVPPGNMLEGSTCDSDGAYTYWGCSKFTEASGKCGGNDLIGKATNIDSK
jgi:hypothetical protein